jgi:hypothetical protein
MKSRTRPNVGRWNQQRGTWTSRQSQQQMTEQALRDREHPPAVAVQDPPARVAHPVIQRSYLKCYRVVRLFTGPHGLSLEDIGAFKSPESAIAMSIRERGRARVFDPNGKLYTDNLQPIESRVDPLPPTERP